MKVQFVKRNHFKEFYTITTLLNDNVIGVSYVTEKTYNWFDNVKCGDEIPNDICDMDLYEREGKLSARITLDVNKFKK